MDLSIILCAVHTFYFAILTKWEQRKRLKSEDGLDVTYDICHPLTIFVTQ